jgi:hypothetical protein
MDLEGIDLSKISCFEAGSERFQRGFCVVGSADVRGYESICTVPGTAYFFHTSFETEA